MIEIFWSPDVEHAFLRPCRKKSAHQKVTVRCHSCVVLHWQQHDLFTAIFLQLFIEISLENSYFWRFWKIVLPIIGDSTVYDSKAAHMTRNLWHLDRTENWVKEMVADGTCVVIKVKSCDNSLDIGTKRVSLPIFNKLLNQISDQSQRRNLT